MLSGLATFQIGTLGPTIRGYGASDLGEELSGKNQAAGRGAGRPKRARMR
jgi:hypothetical protein